MLVLTETTKGLFEQLENALALISAEQYTFRNRLMSDATIGQHVRHIIELFQEMQNGYQTGGINYENRKRDFLIETDKEFAVKQLWLIWAAMHVPDKNLLLTAGYGLNNETNTLTATNYVREVIYNIEHTIHHLALIRIGFKSAFAIELPEAFGVAPSTLKYRKACAQ
jgi:hypothetical protein